MTYTVLGTDGFSCGDNRAALRCLFEIPCPYICRVVTQSEGKANPKDVARVIKQHKLDVDKSTSSVN
jgi:pyruvate dehydrogenase complex dehydrogenase (E1) component